MTTTTHDAIDCQAFAGGMTLGVVQAGFRLVGKREMQGGFGMRNCLMNRDLLGYDWDAEAVAPEAWTPYQVPFVFGNPPCSGFSLLTAKHARGIDAPINACMKELMTFAARCNPQFVAMESVQQAYTQGRPLMQHLRGMLEELTGDPWDLHHVLHNGYCLGGASIRRRYFLVAARGGRPFGIERPEIPRLPLLRDVIGDLSGLGRTWEAQPYRTPPTWWTKDKRSDTGLVDGHWDRDTPQLRRAKDLMTGTSWGEKETISGVARRYYETHGTLPESWEFKREKLVSTDFMMGYNQMSRWAADRAGRVITGGGLDLVLHPWEDRLLTHREVARIMGFPDDWRIRPLRGAPALHNTWGKGILVEVGRWIGGWVKAALDGNPGSYRGDLIGDREWVTNTTEDYRVASQER